MSYTQARDLLTRALHRLANYGQIGAHSVGNQSLADEIETYLNSTTAAGAPMPERWVVQDEASDQFLVRNPGVLAPGVEDSWLFTDTAAGATLFESALEARAAKRIADGVFGLRPLSRRPRLIVTRV